jgi:hypothetical protein
MKSLVFDNPGKVTGRNPHFTWDINWAEFSFCPRIMNDAEDKGNNRQRRLTS